MSKHKSEDYCRVLGISREQLRGKDEAAIEELVNKEFSKRYIEALNSKTPEAQTCQKALSEAKKALLDPQKREEYLRRLPRWVRVWGVLWCVILSCLIGFIVFSVVTDIILNRIVFIFVVISSLLTILGFVSWVWKTLSIKRGAL